MAPLIGIGWTEVLVVALVVFLLFGAARIPTMFKSLGEGLRSFKTGLDGTEDQEPESKPSASSSESPAPASGTKDPP